MQDDTAVALFGVSEKKVEWDDVTVADNLLTKGRNKLQELINATVSIELSAADLHNLDVNIEAFRIGDNVRVISIPHGLDRYFLLSKLHLELDNPSNCSMTLGAVFKTFTQKQLDSQKKVDNMVHTTENMVINVAELSNNVNSVSTKVDNFIVVVGDEYVKVIDFNAYKIEVNQKLGRVYTVKGSVANYVALGNLTNKQIGDVWNVLTSGANYVWTEDGWDKLSETVDLSAYLTEEDADEKYIDTETFDALVARVEALENNNGGGNA